MEWNTCYFPETRAERMARIRREKANRKLMTALCIIGMYAAFIVLTIMWLECKI